MGDQSCRAMTVLAFGITQILVGLAMMVLGVLTCIWYSWAKYAYYAPGVWGGVVIILCGALGLLGGILKKRGIMMAFMIVSILEAIFLWLPVLLLSLWAMTLDLLWSTTYAFNSWSTSQQTSCATTAISGSITSGSTSITYSTSAYGPGYVLCPNVPAANANLGIVALAGFLWVVAIISASVACCAVCRCCGADSDGGGSNNQTYPMQGRP